MPLGLAKAICKNIADCCSQFMLRTMEPPAIDNDNSQIYDMILHDKHAPAETATTLTWRGGNSPSADWTLVVGSTTYRVHRCIVTEGPRMSLIFAQVSND